MCDGRLHCKCVVQATLAACNVAARLSEHPVWTDMDVLPFVGGPFESIPKASPSIVNASDLKLEQVIGCQPCHQAQLLLGNKSISTWGLQL